ncbi:MAG TPA: hypothetical protein VEN81_07350 [Planctomycetota bacterium]|nr:hypothetical protein [Planctomycetota bacterium]
MRTGGVFRVLLGFGAAVAVLGGASIGVLHVAAPDLRLLPQLEVGYRHVVFGFLFMTIFVVAASLLEALGRRDPAPAAPGPEPSPAGAETAKPRSALEARCHEMRTYVDLEMWELALEKASLILKEYPGSREAELVAKNINEIRWKAEPKYVTQVEPMSQEQEKQLRQKGLAQMYQHVKTYMDLEMWELARQKALAIMKNFPESPEAIELMKVFDTIEKKARETVSAGSVQG